MGRVPRIRFRKHWFNVLWLFPLGFLMLIILGAVAQEVLILTMRSGPVLIFSFAPPGRVFDRSSSRALKVIRPSEILTFSRRRPAAAGY
jgi:hypothetical protein